MSERRMATIAAVAVVVLLLLVAMAGPAVVSARPANEIPVQSATADDRPQRPTSRAWNTVPSVNVPLTSAPNGVPNASDTFVESVRVQSAQTDEWLYLRLSWADGTADCGATSPRSFLDAAAVRVSVNISVRPPIPMGNTRNPVNAWYRSADGETEELLTGGPGSTTEFERTAMETTANHDDGRWTVVMSRPLDPDATNRTSSVVNNDVGVAFAARNGSEMERPGRKLVSEWYHSPFDPGPQGPPYESVLRTVAGLVIAGVAFVTIEAMRKN